jgi:DMSO/TMAO reductase YedYZ heme-binding membrane subunit
VATTSGRSRRRHRARRGAPGPVAEHRSKIMTALAAGTIVIVAVLALTSEGHDITAAIQRFMLYYAGVFALLGLTGSVVVGLIATDRVILTPGHRVLAQAVHRAVSFGALAFLIVHIVTEIMAQRVHVIDAFVPFMSPFRTFYIGLGTIASDLILAQVVTSIVRKRFTADGKAWRWRAIHYTAYLSFVFGVLHGLMAGRSAKPYVDWSYGFAIALVAIGLAIRFFAISMRSKEKLGVAPAGSSTSASRMAALHLMQAQAGGTIQMLPPQSMQVQAMPVPALPQVPVYSQPAMAGLPAPAPQRQPRYEPGYLGPPRYEGVPRGGTGPLPQVVGAPVPAYDSGPLPRIDTGPFPQPASGPYPGVNSGSFPRAGTGPLPRVGTGPLPRVGTGPIPRVDTGPLPRVGTGPIPRVDTGPLPRVGSGPFPQMSTGRLPRSAVPRDRRRAGQATWSDPGSVPPQTDRDERRWDDDWSRQGEWSGQGEWSRQDEWSRQGKWSPQDEWARRDDVWRARDERPREERPRAQRPRRGVDGWQ